MAAWKGVLMSEWDLREYLHMPNAFQILLPPITKKNSQKIIRINNIPKIVPSDAYKQYERDCSVFIPRVDKPIDHPVNVACVYYMKTRRRVDLVNLQEATLDILVIYGLLLDDNRNVVYSMDGSRVFYDKENPRTEVTITPITEGEFEKWGKNN